MYIYELEIEQHYADDKEVFSFMLLHENNYSKSQFKQHLQLSKANVQLSSVYGNVEHEELVQEMRNTFGYQIVKPKYTTRIAETPHLHQNDPTSTLLDVEVGDPIY